MTKIKQISRYHYVSEDEKTEVFVKSAGRKVDDKTFRGNWQFSSKHADMMPHRECFSIVVNGEYRVRDIFEDDIQENLRRLGFQIQR